jgi:hypothetical protein
MSRFKSTAAAVAVGLMAVLFSSAAFSQTLTPTAAGAYTPSARNVTAGSGTPGGNILTGNVSETSYRSYLIYNIPAGATVTAATLSLNASGILNGPNTVNVYSVTGNPSDISGGTAAAGATFTDLGEGEVFGAVVATTNSETLTINLNPSALTAINAARGSSIAFGLAMPTFDNSTDAVFASSINTVPRTLTLSTATPAPVPTLSEWAMILLGVMLAGMSAVYVQRRRQVASRRL